MLDSLNTIALTHSYREGFNEILGEHRAASIIKYLPKERIAALDIGAGEGLLAEKLHKTYKSYTAIEPARHYTEKLKKLGIETHETLFEDFESSHLYEAIFCLGVLEHVKDPVALIRKANSLLAVNGLLFITVPNAFSLHRVIGLTNGLLRFPNELQDHDIAVGHQRYYDLVWFLRDIVTGTGVKQDDIIVEGIMLKPVPNCEMQMFSTEQLNMFASYAKSNFVNAAELLAIVKKFPKIYYD